MELCCSTSFHFSVLFHLIHVVFRVWYLKILCKGCWFLLVCVCVSMSCVSVVHLVPMFAPLFVSPFHLFNFLYQVCTFFQTYTERIKKYWTYFICITKILCIAQFWKLTPNFSYKIVSFPITFRSQWVIISNLHTWVVSPFSECL